MQLNLKNPLIFFDLETTGTDVVRDRIIELSFLKVLPNGNEEAKSMRIKPMREVNGQQVVMHVPEEASAVHGIYDDDLADKPSFRELAKTLYRDFEGCDLAGYNSNRFDIPMLAEEFLRADIDVDFMKRRWIDVQTIFYKKEPRTLVAAYRFYCNKELLDAHSAMADTKATYEVLKAQLDRYDDLRNEVSFLSDFSSFNNNVDIAGRLVWDRERQHPVVNFGKYKGQQLREVLLKDQGYYGWIMGADFPLDTKRTFTRFYMLYKKG